MGEDVIAIVANVTVTILCNSSGYDSVVVALTGTEMPMVVTVSEMVVVVTVSRFQWL